MAGFQAKTFTLSSINGGQKYENGQAITANAINAPIEASAYAQALATTQPDVSQAGFIGTPTVQIVQDQTTGLPKFKFSNLKGATGGQVSGSSGNEELLLPESTLDNNGKPRLAYANGSQVNIPTDATIVTDMSLTYSNGNLTVTLKNSSGATIVSKTVQISSGGGNVYT